MLRAAPIHLKDANAFVKLHHRHSVPTVGGKFAVSAWQDDRLVGVAIAGRPVARRADDGWTLEVLRVCTDGTRNANSFLYGIVKRIARLMGYRKIITYTLDEESGSSLRAAGARPVAKVPAAEWGRSCRPRASQSVYAKEKVKWEL